MNRFNARRLEGKVAIVVGGTMGIGLATAERLAAEGAAVVVSSRREANVQRALERLRAAGVRAERLAGVACHAADPQRLVAFALRRFGRIDVLFHNAGVNCAIGHVLEVSAEQLEKLWAVNVSAVLRTVQAVVPHMRRQQSGSIVFNSTIAAFLTSNGISTYGAVKSALISLTAALSAELAPFGIRVNCVAPGPIRTRMARVLYDPTHSKHKKCLQSARSMIDRLGEPEEVAAAVAYFASADSSFVSGETHVVTGGFDARL
ncbi:hypothetical protein M3Y99_00758300 [Aphelenchoides fujianensis]|nr:hypothetical protein M3Y99_00758300 [Aphelenchoides fujianensis]